MPPLSHWSGQLQLETRQGIKYEGRSSQTGTFNFTGIKRDASVAVLHTAVSGKRVLLLIGGAHVAGQASPRTLLPLTPHTVHPAFEDGTDTGFRNVSQLQFDVGEIPKRTYTIP